MYNTLRIEDLPMAYYTETKQFISSGETAVTVILNGGTASIDVLVNGTYQPINTITEDASLIIEGRELKFQVTVAGGAVYEVN